MLLAQNCPPKPLFGARLLKDQTKAAQETKQDQTKAAQETTLTNQ